MNTQAQVNETNFTAKKVVGGTMVIAGAGYLLMQLMVFFINTSTYMN